MCFDDQRFNLDGITVFSLREHNLFDGHFGEVVFDVIQEAEEGGVFDVL